MKIRVVGHGGEEVFPFGQTGPWSEFKEELISQGHTIVSSAYGSKSDALISHKHSLSAIKEAVDNNVPVSRRALVLWEPSIVEKERYQQNILSQYGSIYAPSVIWAEQVGAKPFKWPQDLVLQIEAQDEWLKRKKQFVIIQGNKFSARKGELYSLRRQIIHSMSNQIDLYGTNWNRGFSFDWLHWSSSFINSSFRELKFKSMWGIGRKYRNYRGSVTNKHATLREYKFAIVIENSPDFVSEKLFDCISAGCLVIYIGPDLKQFDLDIDSLIQLNQNRKEIIRECLQLLELDGAAQFEIAQSQNLELRKSAIDWANTIVLRNLARSILGDFA